MNPVMNLQNSHWSQELTDVLKFPSCMQTCCILYDFGVLVSRVICDHRQPWKFFITVDWEEADFWDCLLVCQAARGWMGCSRLKMTQFLWIRSVWDKSLLAKERMVTEGHSSWAFVGSWSVVTCSHVWRTECCKSLLQICNNSGPNSAKPLMGGISWVPELTGVPDSGCDWGQQNNK